MIIFTATEQKLDEATAFMTGKKEISIENTIV
jgi:hypothetical protein